MGDTILPGHSEILLLNGANNDSVENYPPEYPPPEYPPPE